MPNLPATEGLDARILAAVQTARQPRPKQVRPIIVIGAGGIVRAAHLPAYEKAGFPVIGLMDQDVAKAAELASGRGISRTFSSVAEAVRFAPTDAIFDVADRKSTRLNSSHSQISYAVFCLKKKKTTGYTVCSTTPLHPTYASN